MKRILLCVLLALFLLFTCALADSSGTCGLGLTWTLDNAGTLTVTGKGAMVSAPWNTDELRGKISTAAIGEGVENVYANAFAGCTRLSSVSLPASMIDIGRNAFSGCASLTSISIPAKVQKIGTNAFTGCSSLTAFIVAPANQYYCTMSGILYEKGMVALVVFPSASPETSLWIPDSVRTIRTNAFNNPTNLKSLTITESVSTCESGFFLNGLSYLDLPLSLTIPGNAGEAAVSVDVLVYTGKGTVNANPNIRARQVYLNSGITTIAQGAFSGWGTIDVLDLPDTLKVIGANAFSGT